MGREPAGLCYTSRDVVDRYIDLHFQEFVRRLGDLVGDVLVGTFEDELLLLQPEYPHDMTINVPVGDHVLEAFRERNRWDPRSDLVALFEDAGPTTTELRADYYGVVTELLEECWFEPLYEWHEEHGLLRSHDNFGRLSISKQTIQYGDYFQTMRWYQAPGYDDGNIDPKTIETVSDIPIGERNFFDARLAASVAACYDRPRVWGELFHSTGWGYTPERQLAGIAENVCYGMNLYDKHGLYYTTKGGWWEHAPPDTHFRQPYWEHISELNDAATRLCQLFGEGDPGFDVGLLYPATSMHAQWHPEDGIDDRGESIDDRTRELLTSLYHAGRDPAFLDRESLVRGAVENGRFRAGDVDVPALVLGPTTAIHADTLAAFESFHDEGGVVAAVGRLPATVVGADEGRLVDALKTIFGSEATPRAPIESTSMVECGAGIGILADDETNLAGLLDDAAGPGVAAPEGVYHGHRRFGDDRHAFLLLNTCEEEQTVEIELPADGVPERLDLLDGSFESIPQFDRNDGRIAVTLSFAPHEAHVVVIDGDAAGPERLEASLWSVEAVCESGDRLELEGYVEEGTEETACAVVDGRTLTGRVNDGNAETVEIDGPWVVVPVPSLDNRWGDFRYPASDEILGPEVRRFRHRREQPGEDGLGRGWADPGTNDDDWETVAWSFGQYFWRTVTEVGETPTVMPDESPADWEPYVYSTLTGTPDSHPYFGGFVGNVSNQFLSASFDESSRDAWLGEGDESDDRLVHFWTTVRAPAAGPAICHYGSDVERLQIGERVIVGGSAIQPIGNGGSTSATVPLPEGTTPVLLSAREGAATHLVFESPPTSDAPGPVADEPRVSWFDEIDTFDFEALPWMADPVGWYRFDLPAGTRSLTVPVVGDATVWVDGEQTSVREGRASVGPVDDVMTAAVRVEQRRGCYRGAVWTGPVELDVAPSSLDLTDWREFGLDDYSGLVRYETTVDLPSTGDERVVLNLGDVAVSASVTVNGTPVGERFAHPYRFDITDAVGTGENRIKLLVANTLANHFAGEVPTRYVYDEVDQRRSGLFGPVTIDLRPAASIDLSKES